MNSCLSRYCRALPLVIGALYAGVLSAAPLPNLQIVGQYAGPVDGSSIVKYWDAASGVLCYVLAPDESGYKISNDGGYDYSGNSVGAISCVHMPYSPVPPVTRK